MEFIGTAVVLVILIVIVFFAIRSIIKNKCTGNCASCGGGCKEVRKNKHLKNAIAGKKVVTVEGMHCEHCKNSVENAINKIDGAACVVELEKKQALVFMSKDISDDIIKNAIEELDFKVTNIVREF